MKESIFINIGASNHSKNERQSEDYYATDPIAAKLLLKVEPELNNIWGVCMRWRTFKPKFLMKQVN